MTKSVVMVVVVLVITMSTDCVATPPPIEITFFRVLTRRPGELVVTTAFGAYRTSDGGSHWIPSLADRFLRLLRQGENLFAIDSARKLYRSENFGETWVDDGVLDDGEDVLLGRVLEVDGTLYRCTTTAVQISYDVGRSWLRIPVNDGCLDMAASGNAIYVLARNGLSISWDRGMHWVVETSPEFPRFSRLYVDRNNTLYALSSGTRPQIHRSEDAGKHWKPMDFQPALDGTPGILYARRDALYIVAYKGSDFRLPWAYYRYVSGQLTKLNLDGRWYSDIQVAEDGTLYAVTENHICRSNDDGKTWTTLGRTGISAQPIVNSR